MRLVKHSAVLTLAALLAACGGGSSSPTAPRQANVTGTWAAQISSNRDGNFSATFTLVQTGVNVSGTFSVQGGVGGNMQGTVTGFSLAFTAQQGAPCPSTFNGSATVRSDNRQMNGSYSGSDCRGGFSATFVANKQ